MNAVIRPTASYSYVLSAVATCAPLPELLRSRALADSGYESTGQGIKTPVKQPTDGKPLAIDNRAYNRLLRGLRWQGERGFAILVGRWRVLRRTTISPRRIGDVVAAALHLTHFEYKYLAGSC
ncbi:transposase family protein [Actinoplanes utahensis]|uniref:transposase family protein n=1 Tax=Actinoplanes utahensis TaxID=1869 RepID=UPI000691E1CF|nr:transposase family protein [Actinoplanes utahensis]GIF35207.1 hypothetical protein Aut01nite_81930 [Actinoplanes utahensis]